MERSEREIHERDQYFDAVSSWAELEELEQTEPDKMSRRRKILN